MFGKPKKSCAPKSTTVSSSLNDQSWDDWLNGIVKLLPPPMDGHAKSGWTDEDMLKNHLDEVSQRCATVEENNEKLKSRLEALARYISAQTSAFNRRTGKRFQYGGY